jgi:hypothetical protein
MSLCLNNLQWLDVGLFSDENGIWWEVARNGSISPVNRPDIIVPGNGYLDADPHLLIEDDVTVERYLEHIEEKKEQDEILGLFL